MKQTEAIDIMLSGRNVFLTGAPGSGKTYTLNQFIDQAELKGKRVAVTASTGIAASHIGGITIHSWSGLGILEQLSTEDLEYYGNLGRIRKRYINTDVLVIDEVSMLHGVRLNMVNQVAQYIRRSKLPFGGIQVILVGDLFQLPPVTRGTTFYDFVHLSAAWEELQPVCCYITEQHRQGAEDLLVDILVAMRANTITQEHLKALEARCLDPAAPDKITRLFSHNVDVDGINRSKLDALPGKIKKYRMHISGDPRLSTALKNNILAPEVLELKVDAEVMFVANNFAAGYVNGSRGKVIKFKHGDPVVQLQDGQTILVERHSWQTKENGNVVAEVSQYPLRLAWAITIHKSQGMSLDAALIDLSKAFTPGMGYVALSRVRSLSGLYLLGFNDLALLMHDEIYSFDAAMLQESEAVHGSR